MSIIDADQHYYEPDDCCTRHLERRFADQAVHIAVNADGLREWRIADRRFDVERYPRDVTLAPGELERSLSAKDRGQKYNHRMVDGTGPEFTDRASRLKLLDDWDIQAAILFPSSIMSFDSQMTDTPLAACAAARAFNRWVEDDWGYAYDERLFAPPFISLLDVAEACAELERVLAVGARIITIRVGPVDGHSPAHPDFDPFWARVNEARVPVALHITSSGYESAMSRLWGENPNADHFEWSGFQWYLFFATRPIMDTLASLIFHNLFGRFSDLRILSVENGSRWVGPLLDEMDAAYRFVAGTTPNWLGGRITDRPSAIFRQHVYIAPFLDKGHEAPVSDLIDRIGSEHVIFGSDWPHAEGRDTPLAFERELAGIAPTDLTRILRSNTADLLGLPT